MPHPVDCLICDNDPNADCNVVEIQWICSDFFTPLEFCAMFQNRIKCDSQNGALRAEFADCLAEVLNDTDFNSEAFQFIVDNGIVYHENQWWHIYQNQDFYLYRTND